jgi:hypothetical protein
VYIFHAATLATTTDYYIGESVGKNICGWMWLNDRRVNRSMRGYTDGSVKEWGKGWIGGKLWKLNKRMGVCMRRFMDG